MVQLDEIPSSIAAGDGHTLIATESGDVYSCGRGNQGQLGRSLGEKSSVPTLINDLSHESIVRVAASGVSSYAITANGRVYHWGLVHLGGSLKKETATSNNEEYDRVTAGQLTGLAENQENVIVNVDNDARAQSFQGQQMPQYASRQLKDIVTHSTERWMLANDDADLEYYRELESIGYNKEELDEKMQNRGKEYHGMLRITCKRTIVPKPELITSLQHVRIVSLAAGFAHCIALTSEGTMYACGYNDRGQLGLGHRISSSEFKIVDYMQGKIVLQVECGQQHSMCRAIERNTKSSLSVDFLTSSENKVGSAVYVWGNGMLGQLGLGLKGTSKGRLLPTLLTTFSEVSPMGAVDISAGGNFSVAVAYDGTIYSWGHAEYNQHGSSMVGGNDYIDNYFYFVPRPVEICDSKGVKERIVQASCGSTFTIAVTDKGDAYSWGWNSYGVLGHGKGYHGQNAIKITTLGRSQIDRQVTHVCAGSSHAFAITSSSGNSWAKTFSKLLPTSISKGVSLSGTQEPMFSDVDILDEKSGTRFPCHQVMLSARSTYFAGYFRAAKRARSGNPEQEQSREEVVLDCPAANATTINYLLQYIYTDTLSAPSHKCKQLGELADFVSINRLSTLCRLHGRYQDRTQEELPLSTFEEDMSFMVNDSVFADCKFKAMSQIGDNDSEPLVFSGHRVLFSQMPYFRTLFSGEYGDGFSDGDGVLCYDISGLLADGVDMETFERLTKYAYTGAHSVLDVEDSNDLMSLLLASSRVGLFQLSQLCEKRLSLHLNDFPENVQNCLDFARMYNIPRLCRQCEELMTYAD